MRNKLMICLVLTMLIASLTSLVMGEVPGTISYQGRLTTAVGAPITGAANLVFTICGDSLCTQQLWTESQKGVIITNGLFDVRLGSANSIPSSVFNGSLRWLAITVEGQAGSRRFPLQSVPYSYRSIIADTADYAKNGATPDCSGCDSRFVNMIGPDSVRSTYGIAFLGRTVSSSPDWSSLGVMGCASNSSSNLAFGGRFYAGEEGTGQHYGTLSEAYSSTIQTAYGAVGYASNRANGQAVGGNFRTDGVGTGSHYGVQAEALGTSSFDVYGIDATAKNTSTGDTYGGNFEAQSGGSGSHYGVHATSSGNAAASTFGVWSEVTNTSSGDAYGGYFRSNSEGTGTHYAVSGNAYGASSAASYGVTGIAANTSTGNVYAGNFEAQTGGSGGHYGVHSSASGSADPTTFGVWSEGTNTSTGDVYGGYFRANSSGTGAHYALSGNAYGVTTSAVYGSYGSAQNTSTGLAYGGYFRTTASGTGDHYGLRAEGNGSSGHVRGIYCTATSTGSGTAYGGEFYVPDDGNSSHVGISARAEGANASSHYGVMGVGVNTSSGQAYGGYFSAQGGGTGARTGIYASCPLSGNAMAGVFEGSVYVSGNLVVEGVKSAAIKLGDNDYRTVYCQESPENWFEDFGEGQLVSGTAHIDLEPLFLQSVTIDDAHPMRVFVQLEGDCRGVYVTKGATGFDVRELQGGNGNVSFSYRVVAKRKGFEDVRMATVKYPSPEDRAAMRNQAPTERPEPSPDEPSKDQ
jgi:hypothetical protein